MIAMYLRHNTYMYTHHTTYVSSINANIAFQESEASKAIGHKRQARMAMVDEIRQQQEANKRTRAMPVD